MEGGSLGYESDPTAYCFFMFSRKSPPYLHGVSVPPLTRIQVVVPLTFKTSFPRKSKEHLKHTASAAGAKPKMCRYILGSASQVWEVGFRLDRSVSKSYCFCTEEVFIACDVVPVPTSSYMVVRSETEIWTPFCFSRERKAAGLHLSL